MMVSAKSDRIASPGRRLASFLILIGCVFTFPEFAAAQGVPAASPTPEASLKSPVKPAATKSYAAKHGVSRWFDLDALSVSTRYNFIENTNRTKAANNDQYQFVAKGRFKFDAKGRYSVYAGVQTGQNFTSGWDNSAWGTGREQTGIPVKHLYFEAKPTNHIGAQFGGIAINNGVNSEITGYDSDNYIMGERLSLKYPKKLYFDEIHITYANLGSLNRPNVFRRFKLLNTQNYHQFLVIKNLNKRVSFSADYTYESGTDMLRQAVRAKVPETRLLDNVLFENYQRLDPGAGYGFNLQGDKKVFKRLTLTGGFAHIDRPMLNGDRFPRGNRFHLTGVYTISPEFSLTAWVIEGVGPQPGNAVRTRVNVLFTYNVLQSLRRAHIF
jgi:hypothetical protein